MPVPWASWTSICRCCAPKDGMEQAGADMAVLSDRHFRLTHTKRYAQLVTELHADSEGLTPVQKKVVEHLYEAWEKEKNIPAKLNYEMSLAYNRAYSKWLEAKQAADFSLFRDSLAEIISYTHKALDLREQKKPTYYDALLDDTEKGGSIKVSMVYLTMIQEAQNVVTYTINLMKVSRKFQVEKEEL